MTKTATAVRIPTARRGPAGTSQETFRRDVEGLRGIAVALIVLADAGVPGFGGGFLGTDVFFVISGHLIAALLLSRRLGAQRVLPFVVGSAVGGSLAWSALHATAWSDFSPATRIAELGAGGLVALAGTDRHRIPYRLAGGLSWLGLVLIMAGALVFRPGTPLPGLAATVAGLGAVLVLTGRGDGLLGLPPVQWLGRISYAFFLWHFAVLKIVGRSTGGDVVVLGALALAILTYALVERLTRRNVRLSLILTVVVLGLMTGCAAAEPPRPPDAPAPRLPLTKVLAAVRRAPAIRTLPSGLTPSLTAAGQDLGFDSNRCEAGPSATRIDACVFGDPASSTRVVLFGDSHASMWLPALTGIAQRRHWQLRFFGKPGCPVPEITFWRQRPFTGCDRFRSFAEGQILAARPDLVLVADTSYGEKSGPDRTVTAAEWQGALTRTLGTLRRSGARVVVIGDTPVLAESAPECLALHARNIVTCFTTRAMATAQVWNAADEAAARATGSGYVPVLSWLCGTVCTPVVGHVLVYRNRFDLTATYSRMLNGVLEDALVRSFPPENAP